MIYFIGEGIDGLIMESPFYNLQDAARSHPMSLPYRFLPWFEWIFIEPMKAAGLKFETNENVKTIKEPILILHAEDDHIIPVQYGRKLYEIIRELRDGKGIMYKEFDKRLGYRHCDIYLDPDLQNIVRGQSPPQQHRKQRDMSTVRKRRSADPEGQKNKTNETSNTSKETSLQNKTESQNKGFYRVILRKFLKQISGLLFILYVVIPIFVKTNPWIHSKMVFLNMVRWPPFIDLTKPEELGLKGVRNIYLDVNDESRIGVWQILPRSVTEEGCDFEKVLGDGKTVILYMHGTTGTRAGWHRVQLLKLLASLDFHVVAFDYRGYGDSKGTPTEDGVVEDSYFMYKWIKERSKDSSVILWGHSLGTAITTKLARQLCLKNEEPDGIVLESPFNNIRDAAVRHPFTALYRFLPMFKEIFIDTIGENGIYFSSDENIAKVTTPLMIIHAEDDEIVPYELGKKLYEAAEQSRPKGSASVEFITFNASVGLGHKHIFKAPEMPNIIKNFVFETCSKNP